MRESVPAFIEFLRQSQFRFYQERDIGLDLYHNGAQGWFLAFLVASSLLTFLFAIFHVIPERRHVVRLLLGFGILAFVCGLGTSFMHFQWLPEVEARLIRPSAGPLPVSEGQKAAVICFPFVVGSLTLVADTLGCLYMAFFWGTGLVKPDTPRKR
jgi:hypothetical protein